MCKGRNIEMLMKFTFRWFVLLQLEQSFSRVFPLPVDSSGRNQQMIGSLSRGVVALIKSNIDLSQPVCTSVMY